MNPTVLAIALLVRLMYDNESVLEMMRFVSCLFLYKILICSTDLNYSVYARSHLLNKDDVSNF